MPEEVEQAKILFRTTLSVRQALKQITLDERSLVQAQQLGPPAAGLERKFG